MKKEHVLLPMYQVKRMAIGLHTDTPGPTVHCAYIFLCLRVFK